MANPLSFLTWWWILNSFWVPWYNSSNEHSRLYFIIGLLFIKGIDDKSEKTYHTYWTKSTQKYTDGWKEKLNKQLDPAVNALIGLLASDDEKIRQRAVDQIFKLTGNEETRIAIEGSMDVKLSWGDEQAVDI